MAQTKPAAQLPILRPPNETISPIQLDIAPLSLGDSGEPLGSTTELVRPTADQICQCRVGASADEAATCRQSGRGGLTPPQIDLSGEDLITGCTLLAGRRQTFRLAGDIWRPTQCRLVKRARFVFWASLCVGSYNGVDERPAAHISNIRLAKRARQWE